ncbi:MAG TPA: hypothetical protein VHM72_06845 [Solirubrobacteraceae bacterium]|nr:hypothetical protein [Solirubrobacteraceae bacterium]
MATRELKMRWDPAVCEICQRSLLRGEYTVTYYDEERAHAVCELCTTRAHRQGWIREGTEVAELAPAAHAERARSLVARLRGRRDQPQVDPATRERRAEQAAAGEVQVVANDDLPHHVQAVPSGADAQAGRALVLFNASEHARTIAGVVRSLGAPYVHAGRGDGGSLVEVLVVWELCWYRFEVDLENSAVRLRGQGYEPSELGSELQAANALADEHGNLGLAAD